MILLISEEERKIDLLVIIYRWTKRFKNQLNDYRTPELMEQFDCFGFGYEKPGKTEHSSILLVNSSSPKHSWQKRRWSRLRLFPKANWLRIEKRFIGIALSSPEFPTCTFAKHHDQLGLGLMLSAILEERDPTPSGSGWLEFKIDLRIFHQESICQNAKRSKKCIISYRAHVQVEAEKLFLYPGRGLLLS